MVNMSDYRQKVHRSLIQREMFGGIPQMGFLLLLIMGAVFVYGLRLFIMIPLIIVLYIIMRALIKKKKDQWLIDITMANIMQKDRLIP